MTQIPANRIRGNKKARVLLSLVTKPSVGPPRVLCYRSCVKRQSAVATCELREQRDAGCSAVTPPASRHTTFHSIRGRSS